MKRCSKCGKRKDTNCFHNHKGRKDGKIERCKSCRQLDTKLCYKENREYILQRQKIYNKENADKIRVRRKRFRDNNKDKIQSQKQEWYEKNKEKSNEWSRKYYQENKEKIRNRTKKYREENRASLTISKRKYRNNKVAINEHFTAAEDNIVRQIFRNKCFNCSSSKLLCLDHHYPLSKGNALTITNAVLLCRICNSKKHDKDPRKFYTPKQLKSLANIFKKMKSKLMRIKKNGTV